MPAIHNTGFLMTIQINVPPFERVLSALDELIDDYPDLEKAVDFYEEFLPVMYAARPDLDGLMLEVTQANTKLKQGVPLLWGEFEAEPSTELFITLCRLATEGGNEDGEVLLQAVLNGRFDLQEALTQALTLDRAALTRSAASLAITPDSLIVILQHMLMPITQAYAAAFATAVDFSGWRKGYCPVCGDWPILSELRGRDKLRHLRCGRCGSSWSFKRLQCVWCDNINEKELSFLFDQEQSTWRIDVCERCQGYVKTLVSFDPLEVDLLIAHDLRTMFMDQMAVSEGYQRPFKRPLSDQFPL